MLRDQDTVPRSSCLKNKDIHTIPEIRMATNHHDVNIRKWIHRCNEQGIEEIISKLHQHKPVKTSGDMRKGLLRWQPKIQEKTMDYLSRHGLYVS
jgi:transposase